MSWMSPRRTQIAIAILGVGMVVSLATSWLAISRQTAISHREAIRAVATSEQTRVRQDLSICQLLSIFRPGSGRTPPTTSRGLEVAAAVDSMWKAWHCG